MLTPDQIEKINEIKQLSADGVEISSDEVEFLCDLLTHLNDYIVRAEKDIY